MRTGYFLSLLLVLMSFPVAKAAEKKVKVERAFQYEKNSKGDYELKVTPYRESRPKWGVRINLATNQMKTEVAGLKKAGTPIQLDLSFNRNFKNFSLGVEAGYLKGEFEKNNEIEFITGGLGLYLDGIFSEPYVVPFVSAGVIANFDAERAIPEAEGGGYIESDKDFVPYYRFGLLFGLNWMEYTRSLKARSDIGLQNTFLYVALRKITSTNGDDALDLSTTMYLEYGLQLEF